MDGGQFLHVDQRVKKYNSEQADGTIDAGCIIVQDTPLADMLVGLCAFPDKVVIKADTYVHFVLASTWGEDIIIRKRESTNKLAYMQKKVKFHKRLVRGQTPVRFPVGVTSYFLVLLFNGVDRVDAHRQFDPSIAGYSGLCAYAMNVTVLCWYAIQEKDAAEKEMEDEKARWEAMRKEVEELKNQIAQRKAESAATHHRHPVNLL